MTAISRICLLGFGEVGTTLAGELSKSGVELTTYDVLFSESTSKPSLAVHEHPDVVACSSPGVAAQGCQLVVSAVTADQCVVAADSVADALDVGTWYLDLNSVSPGTRKQAAVKIQAAQGRYVESAVMSPIRPLGAASPMLLGGEHAADCQPLLAQFGFSDSRVFAADLGIASAAKMCRSVIIKGLEALITESLLPSRRYGVESVVIESLQNLMPGVDWAEHARYMISRSLAHGSRRAEEMRQVTATLEELGFEAPMSEACASRQAMAAQFSAAANEQDLAAMLDRILEVRGNTTDKKDRVNADH